MAFCKNSIFPFYCNRVTKIKRVVAFIGSNSHLRRKIHLHVFLPEEMWLLFMLRKRFISSFIIEIHIEIKALGLLQDINYEHQPTAVVGFFMV